MTSHQTPSQPAPFSETTAAAPIGWVEQSNGDLILVTPAPPAACTCCGVVHHADDLLFGRCEDCENGAAEATR
jgi:hypothetical protein